MNIDIHNHPIIKPFSHACKLLLKKKMEIIPRNFNLSYLQDNYQNILDKMKNPRRKSSVWRDTKPFYLLNKIFAEIAFAKYSQSNFTNALKGDTRILFVSLYPIEKEYLTKTWDERIFGIPILKNFVTGISAKRIKYIQSADYKYFNDIECKYEYLQTLQNFPGNENARFFIAKSITDLTDLPDNTVAIVLTIEGANNLYPTKYIDKTHISVVLNNINKIKQWPHKVLWITMAHHFYNGFVSHEKSLVSEILMLGNLNQEEGMNQPISVIPHYTYFTEEGIQVIDSLLSTTNGPRILIDLKHIDYNGRKQYYEHIKNNYENNIPVVFSHAAVGSPDAAMPDWFNSWTINLNNDDIEAVCFTNGIIGIEFDQRMLGFNETRHYNKTIHKHYCRTGKKLSLELIWNAIRYIAENAASINIISPTESKIVEPWDIIAIGTDFDGIINPINQFPTLSEMPKLREELTKIIEAYLTDPACPVPIKSQTASTPEQITEKIFYGNAWRFLQNNF